MAVIGIAKVRVDVSVTESKLLPTFEGHTNVTFNVLDNVIEFGVSYSYLFYALVIISIL